MGIQKSKLEIIKLSMADSDDKEFNEPILYMETCVKENNRNLANNGFESVYQFFLSNSYSVNPETKKICNGYMKLLNLEQRLSLKMLLSRSDFELTDNSTERMSTNESDTSERSFNDGIDEMSVHTERTREASTLTTQRDYEREEEEEVTPEYDFSHFWLLERIRMFYMADSVFDLPRMIFTLVKQVENKKCFDIDFIPSPPSFKTKADLNKNIYLPLFSNNPAPLTLFNSFPIPLSNLPIIFNYYLKDDIKLGNVILIKFPTETQMHSGCYVFGYHFNFIGMINHKTLIGVFVNLNKSVNINTLYSDFPGVGDKITSINTISYFSLFQGCDIIELSDKSKYPQPTEMDLIPQQQCYTGLVSTDLVTFFWSTISRDRKKSYTIPRVVRMLYHGYLGDFVVTDEIEPFSIKVHQGMKTTIQDLPYVVLFDHSNKIPFGTISFNVISLLLHYRVPPSTLFDQIPSSIEKKSLETFKLSNPLHYLLSIATEGLKKDERELYIELVKIHAKISKLFEDKRIPWIQSYHLVGIIDPFGVLEAGEVALGIDEVSLNTYGDTVLVSNNNEVHPLSLQRFKIANDKFPLKIFKGVIVFNSKDNFYYLNSTFDNINFSFRSCDFIIIAESREGTKKGLMQYDSTEVVSCMNVNKPFNKLLDVIINQIDLPRKRNLQMHLINSLVNRQMDDFGIYATLLFKLYHTDRIGDVKEGLFNIPFIQTDTNFFGIPLPLNSPQYAFNAMINKFIEQKTNYYIDRFKSNDRKECACRKILEDSYDCNEDYILQAKKQWQTYSRKLAEILGIDKTPTMEFLTGSTIHRSNTIQNQIEGLKKKYRMYSASENERKLTALARYQVVYSQDIQNCPILLSPSFAYIMADLLFINKENQFIIRKTNYEVQAN